MNQRGRDGNVDAGREHVVRRLAGVDVVVRVNLRAENLACQVGQNLVHVHVRRCARAGLEDVDRELAVVVAGSYRIGCFRDGFGDFAV